ncbi:MAG: sigma-54-dependent Fis family transcriptional regulator, partial [Verrucomicrobiales bacterium]|nr:sigma-54-dependent Fis family transcriptional regulator [Verrucomicrobiales bacterium]
MTTEAFRDSDTRFVSVPDTESGKSEMMHRSFDVILCNLSGGAFKGFEFLKDVHRSHPRIPIIGVAATSDTRSAIEAVKAGAFDFLSKPLAQAEVRRALREAIDCSRKGSEPVTIDPKNEFEEETDTLVGNSRAMLDVYKALGRLSPTPVTVLIRGETGTGKELVARALFQHGHRAHRPFITVNCAAIPDNLLESELFGHEKGSFTGAIATRIGKFEQANNATLFLDEIGDLNHALQAKLLRVLQEKRFQRVGGSSEITVDTRIIAATHRPIERMIAEGEFREDLFYRLNVATIKLPPLRDRTGDIPLLVTFFLKRFSRELGLPLVTMSRGALACLESSRLPGNVRQLQNLVRKALLM